MFHPDKEPEDWLAHGGHTADRKGRQSLAFRQSLGDASLAIDHLVSSCTWHCCRPLLTNQRAHDEKRRVWGGIFQEKYALRVRTLSTEGCVPSSLLKGKATLPLRVTRKEQPADFAQHRPLDQCISLQNIKSQPLI